MDNETINIKNILLAEDDPRDVELTLAALEEYNLANDVAVVFNGEEALDYLYRRGNFKTIPVVALTSSRETPDLVEFYKHGVNAYVVKPVDFSEFMKAVKGLGIFWAAVNEPPPYIAKEVTSIRSGEFISPGKKEVKNEIPAPHPAFGR